MEIGLTDKEMIKRFAEELAHLYICADFWLYILNNRDMYANKITEVCELKTCVWLMGLRVIDVVEEAKKIYDYDHIISDKIDYASIRKLHQDYCIPKMKTRPIFIG